MKVGKGYVSYHPMLRDRLSPKLRARMQGKACFNFKVPDEALFKELEQMTAKGFAMCCKGGFASEHEAV